MYLVPFYFPLIFCLNNRVHFCGDSHSGEEIHCIKSQGLRLIKVEEERRERRMKQDKTQRKGKIKKKKGERKREKEINKALSCSALERVSQTHMPVRSGRDLKYLKRVKYKKTERSRASVIWKVHALSKSPELFLMKLIIYTILSNIPTSMTDSRLLLTASFIS